MAVSYKMQIRPGKRRHLRPSTDNRQEPSELMAGSNFRNEQHNVKTAALRVIQHLAVTLTKSMMILRSYRWRGSPSHKQVAELEKPWSGFESRSGAEFPVKIVQRCQCICNDKNWFVDCQTPIFNDRSGPRGGSYPKNLKVWRN